MEQSSPIVQLLIAIIPNLGILTGGLIAFLYLYWVHTRTMLLIQRGEYHPPRFNLRIFCLLTGSLLTCIGLVLTVIFVIMKGVSYTLLGGLIPFSTGIGLLCTFFLYPRDGRL